MAAGRAVCLPAPPAVALRPEDGNARAVVLEHGDFQLPLFGVVVVRRGGAVRKPTIYVYVLRQRRGSGVEYSGSSCNLLHSNSEYLSFSYFRFNGSILDQRGRVESKHSLETAAFLSY